MGVFLLVCSYWIYYYIFVCNVYIFEYMYLELFVMRVGDKVIDREKEIQQFSDKNLIGV